MPVDMWTIGFADPAYASAHIPTGHNHQLQD